MQDNGGPTFTHALLKGSPAIDAGNPDFTPPPLYDQRGPGFDRVVNGRIDTGSFEVQSLTPYSHGNIDAEPNAANHSYTKISSYTEGAADSAAAYYTRAASTITASDACATAQSITIVTSDQ